MTDNQEMPAGLSDVAVAKYGKALWHALETRTPVAPLTDAEPGLAIADAYRIQLAMIAHRQAATGETVIGKKIGVTSRAVMDMLDVRQPDFGHLLSGMVFGEGEALDVGTFISPRAEGEIAFLLKKDLEGPGVSAADVLRATEAVMPCFEIVDSRIRDWKIRIGDTVADNASCGALVLGGLLTTPRALDLATVGMTVEKNGEVVGTGAGAAALGHPANAIAWLANTLGRLGLGLKAGEVVLSGALSALVPVTAGDALRVSIGGLGSVGVRFVGERNN